VAAPLQLEYALWAPDGKHFVARRAPPSQTCLVILTADGSDPRELPYCDALEYPRFWSGDGSWLATFRFDGANTTSGKWFAVEVGGTRHVPLEQAPGAAWLDQRYYPWQIVQQPGCTWPSDPRSAKHFSYWRCG
jgi:hypothetical protein